MEWLDPTSLRDLECPKNEMAYFLNKHAFLKPTNRLKGSGRFKLIFQSVQAWNVFPISFVMSFRIFVTPVIAGVIRMIWTMVMVSWTVRMTRVVAIQITTILFSYWVDFIVIPLLSLRRSSRWRRSCSSQSRFTPGVLDGVSTSFPRYRLPFDGGGNILFQKSQNRHNFWTLIVVKGTLILIEGWALIIKYIYIIA